MKIDKLLKIIDYMQYEQFDNVLKYNLFDDYYLRLIDYNKITKLNQRKITISNKETYALEILVYSVTRTPEFIKTNYPFVVNYMDGNSFDMFTKSKLTNMAVSDFVYTKEIEEENFSEQIFSELLHHNSHILNLPENDIKKLIKYGRYSTTQDISVSYDHQVIDKILDETVAFLGLKNVF